MLPYVLRWLNGLSPDSLVTLEGFQIMRVDRRAEECGKRKGGGIVVFVNERWWNPGPISVKEQCCTRDIELLAVSIQQCYLHREFSHIIITTVCIPALADASAACQLCNTVV